MNEISIVKQDKNNFILKNIFLNSKKFKVYYWIIIGMISSLIIINLWWFLWLDYSRVYFKDIPGVEESFFNGFISDKIKIYSKAKFQPKIMFYGYNSGSTNMFLWIFSLVLLLISIFWPIALYIALFDVFWGTENDQIATANFRKCLIGFYLVVPVIVILIVQNFYITNYSAFSNSFKNQFFSQFKDFQENNLTPVIQEQFEIVESGVTNIFDSKTNKIFSIVSTSISILTLIPIIFYSTFAYLYPFTKMYVTDNPESIVALLKK
ncbi:hypothetical protein [Spiroplasma alleghenense]|uniref:Transmembrane protein n=1 Tax=Spiroplasma alleghenense TaxID=216931 RepID=A0A345Z4N4_9MOLU|nr:hypothetical protein [Spiroplasma alleghenense]AXK51563.1 hypothetical protein SALLE_v1c08930 [Spiroplasma alleghenense]